MIGIKKGNYLMKWFKFPVWILIRSLISIIFTFLDVDLFLKMPKVCLSLSSLADSICLKKKEVVRPPIRLVALDKFGLSSKMEPWYTRTGRRSPYLLYRGKWNKNKISSWGNPPDASDTPDLPLHGRLWLELGFLIII